MAQLEASAVISKGLGPFTKPVLMLGHDVIASSGI